MGAWSVQATVLLAIDLDTLVQKADMVIRAEVLSSQAKIRGERGRILTDVELKSLECWKGVCPEVVTALVVGGKEGGFEQRLPGSVQFIPGEECVVFLAAHGKSRFRILGMAQGKYRLEWKPDSSEPIAIPEEVKNVELIYSDAQRMAMPLRKEMPLSQLRQRVQTKLKSMSGGLKKEKAL
ncbi:MAG: hypothetical protein FWD46_01405 [Cystobacterineae bacterium]|nr:hypothetical protein [Cystobacterineae bacterium]